jgi:hypothetical protein
MKTSDSIEQQEERKNARGETDKTERKGGNRSAHNSDSVRSHSKAARIARLAPFRWQPGKSANPGGRPKRDLAAEIARAVFEQNAEALYKAYTKAALKGNAYAFKELADRAYGKMKESIQHEISQYREASEQEIHTRIAELEHKLGYGPRTPQLLPPADDPKPN